MASQRWKVRVYSGAAATEPCVRYVVDAPNWLIAENVGRRQAAADLGGTPEEYEAEAEGSEEEGTDG